MKDRPVDRFMTWGGGTWGMVFGQPFTHYMGTPTMLVGRPENWETILGEKPLTIGTDDGIFEVVKKQRKAKR